MGRDKQKAIAAAKQLNSILLGSCDLVAQIVGVETLDEHIKWFRVEIMAKKEFADKTVEMYETKFRQLKAAVGSETPVDTITVKDIADAMKPLPTRSAQQLRQVCVDLFSAAVGRGLVETNEAEKVLKPISEKKKRQRLTMEQFKAVHGVAPHWLKNAMDLALITLQRREDIVLMKFDQVEEGVLKVIQKKTKKYDTGYLKIFIGEELGEVLSRCRDNVISPFLVHREPERRKRRAGMHWTQIKPEYITRAFKDITDNLELFEKIPEAQRPTFHEIRALGIKRYKDLGLNPQQLAGHSTEKMTKNYDSEHSEIRWIETKTL